MVVPISTDSLFGLNSALRCTAVVFVAFHTFSDSWVDFLLRNTWTRLRSSEVLIELIKALDSSKIFGSYLLRVRVKIAKKGRDREDRPKMNLRMIAFRARGRRNLQQHQTKKRLSMVELAGYLNGLPKSQARYNETLKCQPEDILTSTPKLDAQIKIAGDRTTAQHQVLRSKY